MKVKKLYLSFSDYENGKKSGTYFKKFIQKEINFYCNLLKNSKIKEQCLKLVQKLKRLYPKYYNEVLGKADGAEVDFNAYFLMLCPELFEGKEHCTTIICKNQEGKFMLTHNEDDCYKKGNFCISKVSTANEWFITNDIYNMPFGNGFSWNSHGIIKTINYCYDPLPNKDNLSRYFSQRYISEATSIDNLIERCKNFKTASGYHVNALDIKNNIAVSIEVFTDSVDVKFIDDYNIHSNHFLRGKFLNNPMTSEISNSIFRLNKASQLFADLNERNLTNIYNILMYRSEEDKFENSIFQTKKDPYLTGFNFSFDPDDNKHIFITDFVNNEKLKLKYDLKK